MSQSKKYKLNKEDGLKILKGAGIAGGGAILAFLLSIIGDVDFGTQTATIVAIASIFLNTTLKWLRK